VRATEEEKLEKTDMPFMLPARMTMRSDSGLLSVVCCTAYCE